VRAKLKKRADRQTMENTFKVSESVDVVELDRATMQYLYKTPTTIISG